MNKKLIIIVILLLFVMSGAVYTYTLNGSSFKNIFGIRPDPPVIPYHFDNSIKGNLFEDKTNSSFSTFTNSRANISFELYNPDQIDLPLEPLVNISVIERGSLQNFTSDGTLGVAFFSRLPGLRMCRIYIYDDNKRFTNGTYDYQSVLTHEIGHCTGLGHSSENPSENNSELRNALMYYSYNGVKVLTKDDINGLFAIYGKKPPRNIQEAKEDFCNSINLDPDGIECLAVICYFAGYCK